MYSCTGTSPSFLRWLQTVSLPLGSILAVGACVLGILSWMDQCSCCLCPKDLLRSLGMGGFGGGLEVEDYRVFLGMLEQDSCRMPAHWLAHASGGGVQAFPRE